MNWLKSRYRKGMRAHNRTLLLLDITFKVIFIVFLLPIFNLSLGYVMHLWGQSYITAGNLTSFLTYPPVIILLLTSAIILGIYMLMKISTMILYTNVKPGELKPNIPKLLMMGLSKTKTLLFSGKLLLLIYTFLLIILINIPLLIGITVYLQIPSDFWSGASDRLFIKGLILLILLFICFITYRGIFTLHFCIYCGQDFITGIRSSKLLLKGRTAKIAVRFLIYNLSLGLLLYLAYYAVLTVSALLVYFLTDKNMVISMFLSLYPQINIYFIIFAAMIAFITNLNILSSLFLSFLPKEQKEMIGLPGDVKPLYPAAAGKYKHILAGILLLVLAFGCLNLYYTIRNDTLYIQEALSGIQITSHRGNSLFVPENTLPALESAIEAHSDYAEIDIQQSRDGFLILMHDRTLWRTTGLNKTTQSLTLRELKELDAGSWFSQDYRNTPIPTLEEALQLCKGKIKLNIDIKAYGREQGLEEALVALIEKYNFEHQCIISSWNYDTLVKLKTLNPKLKTGLILSVAYGNFYGKEAIDFYSIRSVYLSKYMVDRAHRSGKEVHAWTVNKVSEMERMKSLGVDGIITDNPILTKEVLYRDDTSETFITLLNKMLNNRSFFQIVNRPYR